MGPTRSTPSSVRQAMHPSHPMPKLQTATAGAFDDEPDELRLNLSDIPKWRESMEVEGLRPSLLSRLFDLVAPFKR